MIGFSLVNYYDDAGTGVLADQLLATFPEAVVFIRSNSPSALVSRDGLRHVAGENLGYGQGHDFNLQAALASSDSFDAFFFCNTDLTLSITDVGALTARLQHWRDERAFIATSRDDGKPNLGYFLPYFSLGWPILGGRPYAAGNFFGVTHALMPLARFDPEFFLYFEEVELQLRVAAELRIAPELRIGHRPLKLFDSANSTAVRFAPASRVIIARKRHGAVGVGIAHLQNLLVTILKRP